MSSDTVYTAVHDHLVANWTTTPILFENENAEPQTDSGGVPEAYVMVEMTGSLYEAASIGAGSDTDNLYREEGSVFLHVFVPSGLGSTTARAHAKALVNLFRGLDLANGTVRFLGGSIGRGAPGTEDGNWWRLGASVDYQADNP